MNTYTKYAEMQSKYGIKLSDPISAELLNKLTTQAQVLDIVWAANDANQENKSPINLSLTVMAEIRGRANMLLSHKAFKVYAGNKEKLEERADRHYKAEPGHDDGMFKDRHEKIVKKLGLKDIDRPKITEKQKKPESSDTEIPTREFVERVLRPLGGEATEDVFKAAVVATCTEEGRTLNPNWWEITKRNFMEWSKQR